MVPSMLACDFLPPGHVGPALSFLGGVVVDGVGLGAVVLGMARAALHLSAAQREERRVFGTRRPLVPGPRRVVSGVVELEDPSTPALQVDLVQVPQEHTSKNHVWYTWEERDRTIKARPFFLRTDEGTRVYVETAEDVLVADRLTQRPTDRDFGHRTLSTEIKHGDTVRVSGDLQAGLHPRMAGPYRDGTQALVLRAPKRGRMVVATGALSDRYTGRLRFLWLATAGLTLAWLVVVATMVGPFLSASVGMRTDARFDGISTYATQSKSGRVNHYVVKARTADGRVVTGEVSSATHLAVVTSAASDDEGLRIPVVVDRWFPTNSRLGSRAGANGWYIFGITLLGGFALYGLQLRYRKELAWYDSDHVSDHGGTGRYGQR